MSSKAREIAQHFDSQGTPIMVSWSCLSDPCDVDLSDPSDVDTDVDVDLKLYLWCKKSAFATADSRGGTHSHVV